MKKKPFGKGKAWRRKRATFPNKAHVMEAEPYKKKWVNAVIVVLAVLGTLAVAFFCAW